MELNKKVQERQRKYDTLVQNLASGVLPASVLDVDEAINELKLQIEELKDTNPPVDDITKQVWIYLKSIKNKPDKEVVSLLIKRIDIIQTKEKSRCRLHPDLV